MRSGGIPAGGLTPHDWALWSFHTLADEQQRLYEAWRERELHVHALVATSTHDQQTAERAWSALSEDRPPLLPWQRHEHDDDAERWSEERLEADLLMGVRWPFFRERSFERARSNGHQAQHEERGP